MANQRYPWLKLHRRLLDHPWLNQRTEWLAAWVQILMLADHETGVVELGVVPARAEMTEMAWRHFVKKLEREGMIEDVRTENKGRAGGMRKLARLAKWGQYQATPEEQRKEQGLEQGLEHPQEQSLTPSYTAQTTPEEQRKEQGLEQGLTRRLEQSLSILDLEVKKEEVKEEPPPTPPKSKNPKPGGHEFRPEIVPLPPNFDRERFGEFCASRLRLKSPLTELALKRFVAKHEKHPAVVLDRMFDNAIVAGWKDLYDLKPWELEEAKVSAQASAAPNYQKLMPPGTAVEHPVWGRDTIRFYRELDGQAVLNENGALVPPSELRIVEVVSCLN